MHYVLYDHGPKPQHPKNGWIKNERKTGTRKDGKTTRMHYGKYDDKFLTFRAYNHSRGAGAEEQSTVHAVMVLLSLLLHAMSMIMLVQTSVRL